jgi:trimeric autotransporter adhesin
MPNGISPLVAAQLSDDAYTPLSTYLAPTPDNPLPVVPAGWTPLLQDSNVGGTASAPDQYNQFITFVDTTTKQIVVAFKGSDNLSNFKSDLIDSGASEWESVKANFLQALSLLQNDPAYSGYQIMTDGHSLGGGMAQTAALEKDLSGYGQNSLPISQGAINQDIVATGGTFQAALATWLGNTFSETNTAGDPATLYYSSLQGQRYLSTTTTTLPNPWAVLEIAGVIGGKKNGDILHYRAA